MMDHFDAMAENGDDDHLPDWGKFNWRPAGEDAWFESDMPADTPPPDALKRAIEDAWENGLSSADALTGVSELRVPSGEILTFLVETQWDDRSPDFIVSAVGTGEAAA